MINAEFVKSSTHWKDCPEPNKAEYAFIGRSNVGKSSLINMLAEHKGLAKTSSTPGKTQLLNTFIIEDSWYLTDLPGYGYAKVSKTQREKFGKMIQDYLKNRPNLVNTFVLIDSRHAPQKNDLEFMEWLGETQIPFAIVFTKIDKLSSATFQKNLMQYKNEMLKSWEELPKVFSTSAESKIGREEIMNYIEWLNSEIKFS